MVSIEVSTEIARPVHDVFVFVEDEAHMPEWDDDLVKATRTSAGPTAAGSTFHLDIKPFFGSTEGRGEVVGYEADKLIELRFEMGPINPHVWHRFEATANGTRFTRRIEVEPKGPLKVMAPMIGRMLKKKNQAHLARLKAILEA